jgi:putative DNA primase/helicase
MQMYQDLLNRLQGVRPRGKSSWMALCPSHDDKTPSLSIRQTDTGKLLIYCFGGCDLQSALSSVGIDWRSSGNYQKPTQAELAAIKAQRQKEKEEQAAQYQMDAIWSRKQWDEFKFSDSKNPYCQRKQIQPHGCKTGAYIPREKKTGRLLHQYATRNCLVVPMYNAIGELMNLQFIFPAKPANDRPDKSNNPGQKQGCYFPIGELTDTILICEGFSTGASLYEHFGLYTLVSFGKGNLAPVARIARAAYPNHEIVIAGDNDLDGDGQLKAKAAALSIGGKIMIPPTPGHDWNDELNANKKGAL